MSHSFHMLSIQIDTKTLNSFQQHQIVLLCKLYKKGGFHDVRLLDPMRSLDTLE